MAACRQWVEYLPPPDGVLEKCQRISRQALMNFGLPTHELEAWRLTDLNRLKEILNLPISAKDNELKIKTNESFVKAPNNIVQIIIDPLKNPLESTNLPTGFKVLSSKELQEKLDQSKLYDSINENWTIALNHASTEQILALKIEGKELPPLELVIPSQAGFFSPTRVILLLEKNTKLDLLQVVSGSENSAQSHLIDIEVGQDAELQHNFIALGGGQASLLAQIAVNQMNGSNYSFAALQHGWALSRLEPRINQLNGKAKTKLKGLQISNGKQQLATHSSVQFNGPEGQLEQLQKTAASESSHCIFNGEINVPQIAQKTNAAQLSRNLLLSNRARIDTKPELEIVADDVRCTHGATISNLQEEELFYLQSRGIKAETATSLLLKAYCQEILNNFHVDASRWFDINNLLARIK